MDRHIPPDVRAVSPPDSALNVRAAPAPDSALDAHIIPPPDSALDTRAVVTDRDLDKCPDELRMLRRHFGTHTPGLMDARHEYAVLCPLTETPGGLKLLYEVRAASIRQGGEVCFPGGRMEPGESDIACALRETREELSIPPEDVTILGRTDFICNQRGFLLRPVLGLVSPQGMEQLQPSAAEVAEVFTVPVHFFQQTPPDVYAYDLTPVPPENFPYADIGIPENYAWSAGRVEVPVWYWHNRVIWGMTARITRALMKAFP